MDRRTKQFILSLLPALCQPPPDAIQYYEFVYNVLLSIVRPQPDPMLNVRNRLFFEDINTYEGRNMFDLLSNNRCHFYYITGETPETFLQLINLLDINMQQHTIRHKLSVRNRALLFVIWLRTYPSFHFLSSLFNVSTSTIRNEIVLMYKPFERKTKQFVKWPSREEWAGHRGTWVQLPATVGAIDGTSHEINIPTTEPQQQYYSGHRNYHAIHTQIITDTNGTIVHVECGFLGHMNDAQQFALMSRIGPNEDLDFPPDLYILGDKIYPNRYPILTAFTAAQLARRHGMQLRKCLKFNRYLTSYRVCVEHAIARLKSYKAISSVWRHSRRMLVKTVHICAGLTCRRQLIGLNY